MKLRYIFLALNIFLALTLIAEASAYDQPESVEQSLGKYKHRRD